MAAIFPDEKGLVLIDKNYCWVMKTQQAIYYPGPATPFTADRCPFTSKSCQMRTVVSRKEAVRSHGRKYLKRRSDGMFLKRGSGSSQMWAALKVIKSNFATNMSVLEALKFGKSVLGGRESYCWFCALLTGSRQCAKMGGKYWMTLCWRKLGRFNIPTLT